jgi:tetratricopeptide (TPR) repeat protein
MAALPKSSASWYAAMGVVVVAVSRHGQHERLTALADELTSAWSEEQEPTGPTVVAAAYLTMHLFSNGLYDRGERLLARLEAIADRFRDDPAVSGTIHWTRAVPEQFAGHLGRSRALVEAASQCFEGTGDLRHACLAKVTLGYLECLLGAYAAAVPPLRAAYADAERMGLEHLLAVAQHNLGLALGHLGAIEQARAVEAEAIAACVAQGNRRMEGLSRIYLAGILRRAGDLEGAHAEARRAVELLEVVKPLQVFARGELAAVLLALDRFPEALTDAREAMGLLASLGKVDEGEALIRLAYAEALFANGDRLAACAAIAEARDRILATAAGIDDSGRHKTFLENVPENARTLSLAQAWLGEPGAVPP